MRTTCTVLFLLCITLNSWSQSAEKDKSWSPYIDLVGTPVMGYTIGSKGSNVPTYFLLSQGLKGNLGVEVGLMKPVFTPQQDQKGFFTLGASFHLLGISYDGQILNLAENQRSNLNHFRVFIGGKWLPLKKAKFFAISLTPGYGYLFTNISSKDIDGRLSASTIDVSLSISLDLNKFVYNNKKK